MSNQSGIASVKSVVAVASGKGGVGKSTTAVNLALALSAQGQRVGILDGDIYGPSIAMMMGAPEGTRPEMAGENAMLPVMRQGIATMSMAYLVTDKTPMVWRGPMASGALQQMLLQTQWGDLDILIVDMPPGTGDIQLTLSQKASLAGAVIVTTPQDIALLDAVKAIEMFAKVNVPVLGLIENMAIHTCSQCGHQEPIFGEGGGAQKAQEYGVPLLGQLPLALSIREQGDKGTPIVAAAPDSTHATCYVGVAQQLLAQLQQTAPMSMPTITVSDD